MKDWNSIEHKQVSYTHTHGYSAKFKDNALFQEVNIVRKIKMKDDMVYTTDKNSQIELGKNWGLNSSYFILRVKSYFKLIFENQVVINLKYFKATST